MAVQYFSTFALVDEMFSHNRAYVVYGKAYVSQWEATQREAELKQ